MSQPVWNTPAGFLSTANKGETFQYALSCATGNAFTTFNVIAGSLPLGLTLSAPTNPTLAYPTIYGNVSINCLTETSVFTIRAINSNGLNDRAFSITVSDVQPSYLFPDANLGTFPDGMWTYMNVAPLWAVPNWPTDMAIVSGNLPDQLVLDSVSGDITGYINPTVLYSSPLNQPNAEIGAPDLALSANTRVYSFEVQYDPLNTYTYNFTVERQDLFNTGNCNVSLPVYHDPIFLDASFGDNECSSSLANIDLGVIDGDSIYYQFRAEDLEGNTLGFALINGEVIPGNVNLNTETGWLSGYVNRDLSLPPPYEFQVVVYKSANVFANLGYQTVVFCNLTIENPADNSIVWTSPCNLGNLYPGIPSSLSVGAEIVEPFATAAVLPATANCTLKLVGVNIVNGGNGFSIGNVFTVSGGIYSNSANIIVSNVSPYGNPFGTITEVYIDPTVVQRYTKLPLGLTEIWINEAQNANVLNAIFDLSFGVDTVNVLQKGGFYDTATVGFGSAGEGNSAIAITQIYNGEISNIPVVETGDGYQAIPEVTILAKSIVTPTNPIKYSLTAGSIPAGCNFLSNGLLVGIPTSQNFAANICNGNGSLYDFTITASIGQNRSINFTEPDINGSNIVAEDFQTLIQVDKDFSLNLQVNPGNDNPPKTNLSLEFLLDDQDMRTLFTPLQNESIVPNTAIFRQADFYFGIVPHVRMLLAYGISPELPSTVQFAIDQYFQNSTFTFNELKWAQSISEGYEVIYIEPLDAFTNSKYETFEGYINYDTPMGTMEAYPATIPNMINQLNTTLNGFDYNFLPSWMRDIQPNGQILGFVPAIPLLYVKPGCGKKIMYYLQQYYDNIGPTLETIDATTDRLIWNAGYSQNWDSCPLNTLTAQNITVQLSGLVKSGANAIYNVLSGTGYSGNLVPTGTTLIIQGMTNPINNGKFTVITSALGTLTVLNASAIAEDTSAGYGYSLNINSDSSFIINSAIPLTFTPNLTPRTYEYYGNVTINLPGNMTSISNVAAIINDLNIDGIQSVIGPNSTLQIQNIYGCPFIIYDGANTPLVNLGLIPNGNAYANVNTVVVAGWWTNGLTEFDQTVPTTYLDSESSLHLMTENCLLIITEGATFFTDIDAFYDVSDVFLNDDDGAIYIKFKHSSFINQPVVTV